MYHHLSKGSPTGAGSAVSLTGSINKPLLGTGSTSSVNSGGGGGSSKRSGTGGSKRGMWNEKKRAGMSFMIVIAFFAVFALIIIVEIVMIDEKSKAIGVGGRHGMGGSYSRLGGEAAPDYEDVKEEYSIEEALYQKNARVIKEMRMSRNIQIPLAAAPMPNSNSRVHSAAAAGGPDAAAAANKINALPWGSLLPQSMELTLPGYPRGHGEPSDAEWRIVNGTRYKFFVYSAFYDRRSGGRLIRVIGATKTRGPEKVWCRLWYASQNGTGHTSSTSVVARVKVIRENWNLKYSACFVLCPLTTTTTTTGADSTALPFAVSVVSKLRSPPGNVLRLHNGEAERMAEAAAAAAATGNRSTTQSGATATTVIPDSIGVCIKPLHFDYDSALYLLEFLELNALLGVSHFTLYNHTLGPRAACVLQHYQQHGGQPVNGTTADGTTVSYVRPTVQLLPWELRMRSQKEIRTEGLFAALNDCLYRSMYRYQYVALIDLDEFIIPRHNDTLKDLMKWLSLRINSRNTGAYSFQNAFFYLQFADDVLMYDEDAAAAGASSGAASNAAMRAAMITQRKTRRRTKLHPQKQRSKYICKPEAVVEAGNHFVWEFVPGRGSMNVPVDAGILHHYRVCEFGGDDCIKTPSLVDRTAHKHGAALVDRVQLQYAQLKHKCGLLDVPPAPTAPPAARRKQLRFVAAGGAVAAQTNAATIT